MASFMKDIRELYDLLDWIEPAKRRLARQDETLDSLEPHGMRVELR